MICMIQGLYLRPQHACMYDLAGVSDFNIRRLGRWNSDYMSNALCY